MKKATLAILAIATILNANSALAIDAGLLLPRLVFGCPGLGSSGGLFSSTVYTEYSYTHCDTFAGKAFDGIQSGDFFSRMLSALAVPFAFLSEDSTIVLSVKDMHDLGYTDQEITAYSNDLHKINAHSRNVTITNTKELIGFLKTLNLSPVTQELILMN
ncbi:MAG: hypothetical protein ACOYOK_10855 [Pseudobdellovibrionaceae bacterium]